MDRRSRIVGGILLALIAVLVVLVGRTVVGGSTSTTGEDVDVGFLQDMLDHHEQAVRMALIVIGKDDTSSITRAFAADVIASQRYEMGLMDAGLDDHGAQHGAPTRRVMTWMHMSVPFRAMPGLATQAQLNELAQASGADADAQFFRLMIEHHRGGVHMADYARDNADD